MYNKYKVSKVIAIALSIVMVIMAQTEVWDGTSSDVIWYNNNASKDTFFISNAQELAGIRQLVNNEITTFENKTIILTKDIDLAIKNWTPIGNSTVGRMFQGTFDGKGHSILRLSVSGVSYAGLFGYVGANGQIKNIIVNIRGITANASGTAAYSGGLSAYYASTKPIENCGINIENNTSVSSTSNTNTYSGGLVGFISRKTTIYNSSVKGKVSANNGYTYSGGLVGYANDTTTINNSYADGAVSASSNYDCGIVYSGGLVGYTNDTTLINNSYANGAVSGSSTNFRITINSGGLVGYAKDTIIINNSYATCNTSTSSANGSNVSNSGGLIGYANSYSSITNSYSSGTITASGDGTKRIGGIFGIYSQGKNTGLYYNTSGASRVAGSGSPSGIVGLGEAQIKKQSSFFGWDFKDIWAITEDVTSPFLRFFSDVEDEVEPKPVDDLVISPVLDQIYTGSEIKPSIVVKDGETILIEGTHYSLSYYNNVEKSGAALIAVAGISDGGYSGTKYVSFKIIDDVDGDDGDNDNTPIRDNKKLDKKYAILLENTVVSQVAEISIKTPEQARVNIVVYDNLGNVMFQTTGKSSDKFTWDLKNKAGRYVANGGYLIVAEAKGLSGKTWWYSGKVGVKR
ncbi:MAG: hypothetical protein FWF51_00760 [Chitinivibrionia bacterium]|nr:hypothetical protein [Chitinivibrionia bacterium]